MAELSRAYSGVSRDGLAPRAEEVDESGAVAPTSRRRAAKIAWLAAGWVCFGVGVVGVAVPGLPTTGPMLLALACFARGSDRLHHWLLQHRLFGPPLRRWREERVIPLRAKAMAISMMTLSFLYVGFLAPVPGWVVVATGLSIIVGAVVILRYPHRRAH
ncbi:MAG: YbaN family protein [Myxococcota bacterium]